MKKYSLRSWNNEIVYESNSLFSVICFSQDNSKFRYYDLWNNEKNCRINAYGKKVK